MAVAKFNHDREPESIGKLVFVGELVALYQNGWDENCPTEDGWSFCHSDFPGMSIWWPHGGSPR